MHRGMCVPGTYFTYYLGSLHRPDIEGKALASGRDIINGPPGSHIGDGNASTVIFSGDLPVALRASCSGPLQRRFEKWIVAGGHLVDHFDLCGYFLTPTVCNWRPVGGNGWLTTSLPGFPRGRVRTDEAGASNLSGGVHGLVRCEKRSVCCAGSLLRGNVSVFVLCAHGNEPGQTKLFYFCSRPRKPDLKCSRPMPEDLGG